MTDDAYEVCRYVQHYTRKNVYAPKRTQIGCSEAFLDQLVANGVIEVLPLYKGGPAICVVLTEKGRRMAATERKRR